MTYKNSCHENVIFFFTGKKENPLAVWPQTLGQILKYNGHKNSQSWWNLWTLVTSNGIVDIDIMHLLVRRIHPFFIPNISRFSSFLSRSFFNSVWIFFLHNIWVAIDFLFLAISMNSNRKRFVSFCSSTFYALAHMHRKSFSSNLSQKYNEKQESKRGFSNRKKIER